MSKSNQDELLEDWPHECADSVDYLLLGEGATEKDKDKANSQGGTLLEDWPRSKSSCSTSASLDSEEDQDASISAARIRSVRFADTAQLHLYEREPLSYLRSLSYTSKDRRRFIKEAMQDGLIIKSLIDDVPLTSPAESMRYLLHHNVIAQDELIGIEHFCFCKPSSVPMIRKRHTAAVLWMQQQLQHLEQQTEDAAMSLGKFAQSRSLRCTQRARNRARMASTA